MLMNNCKKRIPHQIAASKKKHFLFQQPKNIVPWGISLSTMRTSIHQSFYTSSSSISTCNDTDTYNNQFLRNNRHIFSRGQSRLTITHKSFSSASSSADLAIDKSSLSIDDMYQKKSAVEHVLLRPGMYIGGVEPKKEFCWLYNSVTQKMEREEIEYIPALIKLFDEILVNAADNAIRDPNTSKIDVRISPGTSSFNGTSASLSDINSNYDGSAQECRITITNDGKGVPVVFHQKEQMYVPELVFGHLLTGSNFNDELNPTCTGGRHGYGAKLTNIFSKEFSVTTLDSKRRVQFSQVWSENMSKANEPLITKVPKKAQDFTTVTFVPDLEKFGLVSCLTEDIYKVLMSRVVDIAGCLNKVKVTLNGKEIPVENFETYMKLFKKDEHKAKIDSNSLDVGPKLFYTQVNSRWEVGVSMSQSNQFEHVSFVNNMSTIRGGTHVNYVTNQIASYIADHINSRNKELKVTPSHVKAHLQIFLNTLIENPAFDSQAKEMLTSKPVTYGSTCILSDAFLKRLTSKSAGIVDAIIETARFRQESKFLKQANSKSRKAINIPKLDDAHDAGGKRSNDCTLILTEGDSAKALAVAGLEIIGRQHYGVFPLRGKLLNVRTATLRQLRDAEEISNLCTILGLDPNMSYEDGVIDSLRYGRIMIMADQDHDGSHIKGLIINLFNHFWPNLVKNENFIHQFVTPVIKVFKGKKSLTFYNVIDYKIWRDTLSEGNDSIEKWRVKYYKGLGTSTSAEAKEYFSNLDQNRKVFCHHGEEDNVALDMAFNKDRAGERKVWLNEYTAGESIDTNLPEISIKEFVDVELRQFSRMDLQRSIPSVVDGLKPSQRKVLYACFKRKLSSEIKVAQLAGYCSEHTAYHHGEQSLHSAIIGMAQDFVGSKNLPLLYPSGQFGTRLDGGKDAASPRYIFTRLNSITRKIFPEVDDSILNYCEDDGQLVEPEHFIPIIPMVLVNGSVGIGTGWSTNIPTYNPKDIIDNIIRKIEDKHYEDIHPWVKNFAGEIIKQKENIYSTVGIVRVGKSKRNGEDNRKFEILELPIGRWTSDYKEMLSKYAEQGYVKEIKEMHTTNKVHFKISLTKSGYHFAKSLGFKKFFKLSTSISLVNMHAFDKNNIIKKYSTPYEIMDDFFEVRLEAYQKRKMLLENKLQSRFKILSNKKNFIVAVSDRKIDILSSKSKADIIQMLYNEKYDPMSQIKSNSYSYGIDNNDLILTNENNGSGKETVIGSKEFDYLLSMPIYSFSKELVNQLQEDLSKVENELNLLKKKRAKDLWIEDLRVLRKSIS